MKIELVMKEMSSDACKEIAKELWSIVERIQNKETHYREGMTEITGCKHIIQSMALDWSFNGQKKKIGRVSRELLDSK